MKKFILFFSIVIVLYSSFRIFYDSNSGTGVVYAVSVIGQENEIMKAARTGLDKFLPMIPSGYENLYGFNSREDFLKADAGTPYEVYSISTEFLKNEGSDMKDYFYQTDEWRVPVIVNGRMCCLLTVVKENELYKCVDLGGAALANELSNYEKFFNSELQKKAILRLYQINCDFLVFIPKNGSLSNGDFYALSSSRTSLGTYQTIGESAYRFDEVSPVIKLKYSEEPGIKN